jgi:predicted nucleic acid-binding protein
MLAAAADLADEHSLRGYDSIQLAAAVSLREADDVLFTCWDAELNAAARNAGLRTAA